MKNVWLVEMWIKNGNEEPRKERDIERRAMQLSATLKGFVAVDIFNVFHLLNLASKDNKNNTTAQYEYSVKGSTARNELYSTMRQINFWRKMQNDGKRELKENKTTSSFYCLPFSVIAWKIGLFVLHVTWSALF